MGLTKSAVGKNAVDCSLTIRKKSPDERIIALAGNPNVGKSTVFNALTGLNQHTGNWPGKTVANAMGSCKYENKSYVFVDIPGTYSLLAHSAEEEVARNFICFGNPDAIIVVCDATCLERNLNLVLQTLEISKNVIVCVNLMDEAKKKNICVDLKLLSKRLGVKVVSTVARKKKSLAPLLKNLDKILTNERTKTPYRVTYCNELEEAISKLEPIVERLSENKINSRWLSLKLIDCDEDLKSEIASFLGGAFFENEELLKTIESVKKELLEKGFTSDKIKDCMVTAVVESAEKICRGVISPQNGGYSKFDRKTDEILTSRKFGYPIMLVLLTFIFWLTISGANYPSQLLSNALFSLQEKISDVFIYFNAPPWLHGIIVLGAFRVLAWVTSVMLPPMAIFFPLFTLLEDLGYLPRIAYNLDKPFKKCRACGKQALTMCMGFGCNAAGIVGCRIIDSPRERLLAILTNNFVPCNGRFPILITMITMFFIGGSKSFTSGILSSFLLTAIILLGIIVSFVVTYLLSITILKGEPSSFALELPPYRRPQIGRVLVRSILDRTLFVLGRAAAVAAPAGALIWVMANVSISGVTLLAHCSNFLDPMARLMGLDGVILMAFILGFPANEIVIPIIVMAYMAQGSITELASINVLRQLFVEHGWTWVTAASVMLFTLFHWPCSTTLLTVKKETGSIKWTVLAAIIPTITGIALCMLLNFSTYWF